MIYLLQLFLMLDPQPRTVTCSATSFGQHGDKHGGRTPTLLYNRPVGPKDFGIAHRTWPLGARIEITNLRTGKSARGVVLDRGTYGMRDENGWFNSKRKKNKKRAAKLIARVGKKEAYCGCADITYPLAKRIGHKGRNKVKIKLLRKRK